MSTATKGWRLEGGRWIDAEAIPLTDRAVRYGMSVFETIGVRDGKLLFAGEHARMLSVSVQSLLGIRFELTTPPLPTGDRGVMRVYVTAGDGRPADPVREPRVFALFESLIGELPDSQTARLHSEPASPFAHGAKTGNYWTQCAAQSAACADGFDHALLFDAEGRLLSAAMGNVFFIREGALCTPSPALAVRPGVMRAWAMAQQPVREVEFAASRLEEAEEVFLTNSRVGVMPLRVGKLAPGPVGCTLRDRCRRENIIP